MFQTEAMEREILQRISRVEFLLERIGARQLTLLYRSFTLEAIMQTVSPQLQKVLDQVAAQETVEASAITLIQSLKSELDQALASGDLPAIQALSDRLGADTQALAKAVTDNTPAAAPAPASTTAPAAADPATVATDPPASADPATVATDPPAAV